MTYQKIKIFKQLLFPISVIGLYLVLWHVAPEKTVVALRNSMGIFKNILLPLGLVFLLMIGLNLFLKPPHLVKLLEKGTSLQRYFFSSVAGIISAGPIYAWYPMLKDLREKGVPYSLIAVFLVNRAIKPFLLPMMISFFGWIYVLVLTILTVAGSFCVGFAVGVFVDGSPREIGSGHISDQQKG